MNITKKDAAWNMIATFLKIGSNMIILPLIMHYIPTQEYGLWIVFLSYGALIQLIDFGFANNFTRNIAYIFSGATLLQKEGILVIDNPNNTISYTLLKGMIKTMQFYYTRIALLAFFILGIVGTIHLSFLFKKNNIENTTMIYLAWIIYILFLCYQLYTLYYESLLMGRGFVKKQMQTTIMAQIVYVGISAFGVIYGLGILSMISGLVGSIILNRLLSRTFFYNHDIKKNLSSVVSENSKTIFKTIAPNAIKLGITTLGAFLITRSSIFLGSIYLPLSTIASYGLTKQLVDTIVGVAFIWYNTYYPRMTFFRVNGNLNGVKRLYLKSWIFFVLLFVFCGSILLLLGNQVLLFIQSKTTLLPLGLVAFMLIVSLLETNHSLAGGILLLDNKVPFFKASIIGGVATFCLLFLLLHFYVDISTLILSPFITQLAYSNWKWPYEVIKKYHIRLKDFKNLI